MSPRCYRCASPEAETRPHLGFGSEAESALGLALEAEIWKLLAWGCSPKCSSHQSANGTASGLLPDTGRHEACLAE